MNPDKAFNVFKSNDDGASFAYVTTIPASSVIGYVEVTPQITALPYYFDWASDLRVIVPEGSLMSSIEPLSLLDSNTINIAVVGNEIIKFAYAELVSATEYKLSGLLRGLLGTEHEISNHSHGEKFVLLEQVKIKKLTTLSTEWNIDKKYRVGIDSLPVTSEYYKENIFNCKGVAYRPYSPVHIRGQKTEANDIIFSWIRRTRGDGTWKNGSFDRESLSNMGSLPQYPEVPLSEESEQYVIEIMSAGNIKRIKTSNNTSCTYTSSEQVEDFGAVQNNITVRISQMSNLYGKGMYREVVITL